MFSRVLEVISPTTVEPFKLYSFPIPNMIVASFEGFERGDLDLKSPLIHSSSRWEGGLLGSRSWSHWFTSTIVLPLVPP
jgi:hypothetical protein